MAARHRPLPQRQPQRQLRSIVGAVVNAARVAAPIVAVAVIAVLLHRQYVNDEFTIEAFESVRRLHNRRNRERTALQQTLTACLHVTKLYSQVLHKVAITAGRDALQSTQSCGTLLYWLLRPFVLLGGLVLQWAMLGTYVLLYEYILVRGLLSPQAIQHVKKVFWSLVRWQQSLTPRQKAAECLAVISIIFIYKLVKFLQRRRYLRTLQGWIHRRRYALNRSYHAAVRRVTRISVNLALMIPHATYWGLCAVVKLLIPGVVTWIATETQANAILSTAFPLVTTIWLLWKSMRLEQLQHELNEVDKSTAATTASNSSHRNHRLSRHPRHEDEDEQHRALVERDAELNKRRLVDMMRYWMVCATVTMVKQAWHVVPLSKRLLRAYPPFQSVLSQLELAAWLWLFIVPLLLTPVYIRQLPNYRTSVEAIVATILMPLFPALHAQVASTISDVAWQRFVLEPSKQLLGVVVWSKMLSTDSRDALQELIHDSRGLVAPTILLLTLWPLTSMGLIYLAFVVPLAHCCNVAMDIAAALAATADVPVVTVELASSIRHWLQFFVLHTVVTAVYTSCRAWLAWIPLANLVVGVLYGLLATIRAPLMNRLYIVAVQSELQALVSLLSSEENDDADGNGESRRGRAVDSKLIQAFHFVIDKLPRAADHVDDEDNAGDDANDGNGHQQRVVLDNDDLNEDEDDAFLKENVHKRQNNTTRTSHQESLSPPSKLTNRRVTTTSPANGSADVLRRRSARQANKGSGSHRNGASTASAGMDNDENESISASSSASSTASYTKGTASSRARQRRTTHS